MDREPDGPEDAESRRPSVRGWRRLLAAVLVVGAALVAVFALRLGGVIGTASAPAGVRSPTPTATARPTVSQIYQRVRPSVVIIRAGNALGTGVIVADNGAIMTANHVIAGTRDINVTFADGTTARAAVASADPKQDMATLITTARLDVLVLATLGGTANFGASVIAVGTPLSLSYSVSSGIVSGLNRSVETHDGKYSGLIQFDAPVNPGSSGGPLLDAQGLVIGIVVSIADPGHDDAFAGIGFAVPIGSAIGGGRGTLGNGPQI